MSSVNSHDHATPGSERFLNEVAMEHDDRGTLAILQADSDAAIVAELAPTGRRTVATGEASGAAARRNPWRVRPQTDIRSVGAVEALGAALRVRLASRGLGERDGKPTWAQHDGAVDGNSPAVGYTYAIEPMATGNFSRQTELVYPDGWILETTYGASGSTDDRISRADSLRDEGTSDVYAAYAFIGMGTPAIVDYGIPEVRLSRFHAHNGTTTTGQYPGLDRFGRVARQLWTDDDFGAHGSVGTVPNKPPIVSLAYTYDNASSRTGAFDARPGSIQPLSHMYSYDGLHRLIDARRGVWDGDLGTPSVTQLKNSQEWSLDPLGNWDAVGTASGSGIGGGDIEERDHRDAPSGNPENRVNQLMSRELSTAAGGQTVSIDYDFAGNMRRQELTNDGTDTTALVFTHDAWNRLVGVQYEDETPTLHDRGDYEYNGLNCLSAPADHSGSALAPSVGSQCSVRRFDSDVENTPHALDTEQVLLYDADWRVSERRVNSAYDPMDEEPEIGRIIQHVWGLRYIDDVVATRHDINPSAEDGHELIFFHITDAQFATVAILASTGQLLERVTYSAYGVARHHRAADLDGDGQVDGADLGPVSALNGKTIADAEYRAEADLNRDGAISGADLGLVLAAWGPAEPPGALSGDAVRNEIGYAGYQFAPEAGNLGAYLARNRWLDPELGRWGQRDPLGYIRGIHLLQFNRSNPRSSLDPFGTGDYIIGSEAPPDASDRLQAESDASYNSQSTPGWLAIKEIELRAFAEARGGSLAGYGNAARHLYHFLGGSGSTYTIRFRDMNAESPSARRHLIRELDDAMSAAEQLGRDGSTVTIVTLAEVRASNSSGDWLFAVGGYRTWARGTVTQCGDQFEMKWEFRFRDFYDWDPSSSAGGVLVTDQEMASLHASVHSKAREYRMVGEHDIHITWRRGQRHGSGAEIGGGGRSPIPPDRLRDDSRRKRKRR